MLIYELLRYSDNILEEAQRLEKEGLSHKQAYKIALLEYIDYIVKYNHIKNNTIIIAPGNDIDNGVIYNKETGETVKELI